MKKRKKTPTLLEPITGDIESKKFVVYDIESKDGPSQKAGFTRPFRVGFYDGETDSYSEFYEPLRKLARKGTKIVSTMKCAFCKRELRSVDDPDKLPVCRARSFVHWLMRKEKAKKSEAFLFEGPPPPKKCKLTGWEELHLEPGRGCIDQFLRKFLTEKYDGYILYAHAGGIFDHLFLLTWLTRHRAEGFDFRVIPVQSTIQQIKVTRTFKKKTKITSPRGKTRWSKGKETTLTWYIQDSMRLMPSSLNKYGWALCKEKKEDMDLEHHESDPLWSIYLKKDCTLLYKCLVAYHELIEKRLGGEVGLTAPSTAMKLFRRRFLKEPIQRHLHWPECTDKEACEAATSGCFHAWVRQAYSGGRTEIFELIGTMLKYYDLNSSYVAAMLREMPVGVRKILNFDEPNNGDQIDWSERGKSVGFAEVTVFIPETCMYPPLPVRHDGKLKFMHGTISGVWDVDELALLYHPAVRGHIVETRRVAWIAHAPVLAEMMKTLWSFRDKKNPNHDEAMDELAKLMGNSSYGKFGMNPEKEEIVFVTKKPKKHALHDETGSPAGFTYDCKVCGKESKQRLCSACEGSKAAGGDPDSIVWFRARRVQAPYIIPQIAAHITTIARIRLWDFIQLAATKKLVVATKDGEEVARVTVGETPLAYMTPSVVANDQVPWWTNLAQGTIGHDAWKEALMKTDEAMRVEVARWQGEGCEVTVDQGRVFNVDTDSTMTNVELPQSKELGDMKDEYPGERLDGVFIQPKCYKLTKVTPDPETGVVKPFKGSHLDSCQGQAKKNCKGCSTVKVAMKGVPADQRTIDNIERLQRGEYIEFDRLEKCRTLASTGFTRPPAIVDVKKRIVAAYDKRVILGDGRSTAPMEWDDG